MAISKISSSSIDPNVSLGDGFLKVDSTNNRVGIGTSSPSEQLHVTGIVKANAGFILGNSSYLYESATDHFNIRIGTDGPYLTFADAGNNVAEVGSASGQLALVSAGAERMRIDNSGYITKPNQPCILLDGNDGNINAVAAGEIEKRFSVDFNVGITWNATTGAVTVPVAGKYLWYMQVYDSSSGTTNTRIQILHNGTGELLSHYGPADNYGTLNLSIILDMQANDYVQLQHLYNSTIYTGLGHQRIYGYLLG